MNSTPVGAATAAQESEGPRSMPSAIALPARRISQLPRGCDLRAGDAERGRQPSAARHAVAELAVAAAAPALPPGGGRAGAAARGLRDDVVDGRERLAGRRVEDDRRRRGRAAAADLPVLVVAPAIEVAVGRASARHRAAAGDLGRAHERRARVGHDRLGHVLILVGVVVARALAELRVPVRADAGHAGIRVHPARVVVAGADRGRGRDLDRSRLVGVAAGAELARAVVAPAPEVAGLLHAEEVVSGDQLLGAGERRAALHDRPGNVAGGVAAVAELAVAVVAPAVDGAGRGERACGLAAGRDGERAGQRCGARAVRLEHRHGLVRVGRRVVAEHAAVVAAPAVDRTAGAHRATEHEAGAERADVGEGPGAVNDLRGRRHVDVAAVAVAELAVVLVAGAPQRVILLEEAADVVAEVDLGDALVAHAGVAVRAGDARRARALLARGAARLTERAARRNRCVGRRGALAAAPVAGARFEAVAARAVHVGKRAEALGLAAARLAREHALLTRRALVRVRLRARGREQTGDQGGAAPHRDQNVTMDSGR